MSTPPPPSPDRVARRTADHAESVRADRAWWDAEAETYYEEHGAFLGDADLVWGPEGWTEAELEPPHNRYDWQRWRANVTLPEAGYYEVWARATDMNGVMQPPVSPGWNPRGYANNIQHRIAVVAA